jgi:tRNA G18 (ribose-2'-O)-methylase SpoU
METNSVVFFRTQSYDKLANPPVVAAWQIINPENIGNLIRLADNLGTADVFILGSGFQLRMASVRKTAGLSFSHVRLHLMAPEEFFDRIGSDYHLIAIETSEDSVNIFTGQLPEKVVFLLGNERRGLPDQILQRCEKKVHIPMTGRCKSMNVSHALAVVLFEWQRQQFFKEV